MMNPRVLFLSGFLAAALAAARAGAGETLAERLLAAYDGVQSVACRIHKETTVGGRSVATLSRVFYQRPDRLHVDNYAPVRRTIVCDGTNFASYAQGDPRGFSRPVEKLDEDMLFQLRKVPGTAMDHLFKLRGLAETNLPPEGFAERKGYDAGRVFVVLCADATGRLARVEFYATPSLRDRTAVYDYSDFAAAAPGVWIPRRHEGRFRVGGAESAETVRVERLAVNEPIAPGLFRLANFFEDVRFVDRFEDIYR
mgnify:CR=1 FL=1